MTNFIKEEDAIGKMNGDLKELEKEIIAPFSIPQKPIVFIVGIQRSGTSLLNQLLINNFDLWYPNNVVARFWEAPVTGSILSKSLIESKAEISYNSFLGYSSEIEGPHEFGYFWRKFFPTGRIVSSNEIENTKYKELQKTLNAIEVYNQTPLLFKNLVQVSQNIHALRRLIPESLFIYVKRDPFYTIQSTFLSRLELYDDPNLWFGVRPPEYDDLINQEPINQIAFQNFYVKKHIEEQLTEVTSSHKFEIEYEQIIADPHQSLLEISEFLGNQGIEASDQFKIPIQLADGNTVKVSKDIQQKISEAIKEI